MLSASTIVYLSSHILHWELFDVHVAKKTRLDRAFSASLASSLSTNLSQLHCSIVKHMLRDRGQRLINGTYYIKLQNIIISFPGIADIA